MVQPESKYSRALQIYDSVDPDAYPTQRSFSAAVIAKFISELDMTKSCARTYAYRIRKQLNSGQTVSNATASNEQPVVDTEVEDS